MDERRGIWTCTSDLDLLRRLARVGFDWLVVDAQHGPVGRDGLYGVGRALADAPLPWLVRVPSVDPEWIGASLDAGAAGVIVPSVTGRADAERAALATRYPPLGERSWGPFGPLWSGQAPGTEDANEGVRCWVMIETPGALDEVEEIAATPGVDGLFVGPFDLSLSLGTTPDALLGDHGDDSPVARVVAAAERQGIDVGAFAGTPENSRRFRAFGIGFLAVTNDAEVVQAGARALLDDVSRTS